jgi:D-sedoheptulose 7-phosphate isomerase
MKEIIDKEITEHLRAAKLLYSLSDDIASSAMLCINCLNTGGKILICGNGGSAADAQHFAAELVGRYKTNRKGIAAIALTTDTSALTSIGNDFGFDYVFERQVEALAKKGDVVIGISTSGRSKNISSALKLASKSSCKTIGLSGKDGGEMNKICNINLTAPSMETPRVQEIHIAIIHIICHLIDQEFSSNS